MQHSIRWALIGWAALLLGACLYTTTVSAQQRVVRVGVHNNGPTILMSHNGQPGGILGDLIVAIAKEENWNLQAVQCTWQECLDALQTGHLDLLADMSFSELREHLYDFHQIPALRSWSQVYERRNGNIKSFLDLDTKHIAVLAGSTQFEYLIALANGFGFHPNLLPLGTLESGFDMVADGSADAVVADYFFGELYAAQYGLVTTPIMFQPSQLFYATKRGYNGELLTAIDRHLAQWQNTPGSRYYRTLQEWGAAQSVGVAPASFWWTIAALVCLLLAAMGIAALLKIQVARQTRHLQISETKLNTILNSVDAHIYIKDCNLRYVYGNSHLCELFGKSPEELIGSTDNDFFDKTTCSNLRRNDLRVTEGGERVIIEEPNVASDGQAIATFLSIKVPLRGPSGDIQALCGISTDITEHKATQEAAHRLAYYDPLTELPNRRLLLERINHLLEDTDEIPAISALLFLDLDNFKRINDARGHDIGDAVLCRVAELLLSLVGPEDTVARMGGDEFVILLKHMGYDPEESRQAALLIAEQVRAALEQPITFKRQDYQVGASLGVTLLTPGDTSTADVLREADMAMYRSKSAGRNQVNLYEDSMHSELRDRLALEHDLNQAIGTSQIEMQIQAQWDNAHCTVGAELLMRWNHPERGPISPGVFIPLAEETGIILRLGDWALQQAGIMLSQLRQAGECYPLSINVSPRQFRQPNFVQRVQEILEESGAPADQLIFEVTEGILIDDWQGCIKRMTELNALGIRFSIDDFGTGYSSLTYLKRLPLYELKISECFVRETPKNADDTAIVKLILAMARQLSLKVVAEGVETTKQADFLISNGCDAMQGFLFSRPMPMEQWLDQKTAA